MELHISPVPFQAFPGRQLNFRRSGEAPPKATGAAAAASSDPTGRRPPPIDHPPRHQGHHPTYHLQCPASGLTGQTMQPPRRRPPEQQAWRVAALHAAGSERPAIRWRRARRDVGAGPTHGAARNLLPAPAAEIQRRSLTRGGGIPWAAGLPVACRRGRVGASVRRRFFFF